MKLGRSRFMTMAAPATTLSLTRYLKADISCKHGEPYWNRKRIHICSQRHARSFATAKCGNNAMLGKWVLIGYI
ncbi:MAG: hypothetical protein FRX49_07312 [Trebouxia sp. A1-2]|nr:MAG: hypothetical protein FRX49_07312 [Trebouxia sp. A1-2]